MSRRQKCYMYAVRWVDIVSHAGWHNPEAVEAMEPMQCEDVGWLWHEDDTKLILVRSHSEDGGVGDVTVIPKGCVVSKTRVRRNKRKSP